MRWRLENIRFLLDMMLGKRYVALKIVCNEVWCYDAHHSFPLGKSDDWILLSVARQKKDILVGGNLGSVNGQQNGEEF